MSTNIGLEGVCADWNPHTCQIWLMPLHILPELWSAHQCSPDFTSGHPLPLALGQPHPLGNSNTRLVTTVW